LRGVRASAAGVTLPPLVYLLFPPVMRVRCTNRTDSSTQYQRYHLLSAAAFNSSQNRNFVHMKGEPFDPPDHEARSGGIVGQNETAITPTCKDRIAAYGAKTVLFGVLLILSGCTREEATASLRGDLQVDEFEIVHARFPCRSPHMHFFGYRFRIGLKGEYAFGDICWDASAQKWTWQILPNYPLSRLNIRK